MEVLKLEREVKVLQEKVKRMEEEYRRKLEEKADELATFKPLTYKEVPKTGHLYVIRTDADGAVKVGRTGQSSVADRIKGLQTGVMNDIEILLDFPTSDEILLEKLVHKALDKYRSNKRREFFMCDVDFIKRVVVACGEFIDTLTSMYDTITEEEFISRLYGKDIMLEKSFVSEADQDIWKIKHILIINYERGNDNDFVRVKEVKNLLKLNNIEKRNKIGLKGLMKRVFDASFQEEKRIGKQRIRRVFVGVRPKQSSSNQ